MLTPEQQQQANERIARATTFLTELRDGSSLADAARHAGYDYSFASRLASGILGWDPTWRKPSPTSNHDIGAIVLARAQGKTYMEIAASMGVSRQRVEQILLEHGVDHRAITGELKRRRRESAAASRKRTREAWMARRVELRRQRYARDIQLWAEGKTMKEIAAATGRSFNNTAAIIARMRKQHGWFPLRKHRRSRQDQAT